MKQTIEIEVPDGKIAVWKDNKVVFEDIKPQLPKTWEEFCENYPVKSEEFFIGSLGKILTPGFRDRDIYVDRNVLPNYKAAEAHLALMQLHQLRDCYREGWEPDWKSNYYDKYVIVKDKDIHISVNNWTRRFLAFQDRERVREFLTNFRDLIEQAGDLI